MNRVPKLRFPEFNEEWEEKRITDISILKGGYAFKSDKFSSEKSLYQVIKMGNIYQNNLLLDKNPSYLSEITERENEYLLKNGDIIITLTGTVGKKDFGYSYQITEEENLLLNQRLALFRTSPNSDNNKFLRYILLKEQFLDQFFESSTGGTGNQANVSIKNMEEFIVTTTSLPEQQEIASFLSSVDFKIEKLERKKELWEQYKKGMMQKIFSQELRFKGENGEDYPEWEEKFIEDVLTIGSGKDYKHLGDGDIPVFGTGGHMTNVDDFLYDGESVFIGRKGTINKPFYFNGKFWNVDTLFYTHSFKGVSPKFVYIIFQNIDWLQYNEASGVPSLSKSTINIISVDVPSVAEQSQIADFLFSIDSKLEIVEKELAGMKEFKKGLLQQMFV